MPFVTAQRLPSGTLIPRRLPRFPKIFLPSKRRAFGWCSPRSSCTDLSFSPVIWNSQGASTKSVPSTHSLSQQRRVSVALPALQGIWRLQAEEGTVSYWIGTASPTDAGMADFKDCLKHLRDGHPDEALLHARRALGIAPKNPF